MFTFIDAMSRAVNELIKEGLDEDDGREANFVVGLLRALEPSDDRDEVDNTLGLDLDA